MRGGVLTLTTLVYNAIKIFVIRFDDLLHIGLAYSQNTPWKTWAILHPRASFWFWGRLGWFLKWY